MRRLRFMICFLLLGHPTSNAQHASSVEASPAILKITQRDFKIPFELRPEDQPRYVSLELWHSTDQGKNWERIATVRPEDGHFRVRKASVGLHCYAVRTQDDKGRFSPREINELKSSMQVLIEADHKIAPIIEPENAPRKPDKEPGLETSGDYVDYRVVACLAKTRFIPCGKTGLR